MKNKTIAKEEVLKIINEIPTKETTKVWVPGYYKEVEISEKEDEHLWRTHSIKTGKPIPAYKISDSFKKSNENVKKAMREWKERIRIRNIKLSAAYKKGKRAINHLRNRN